jgi:5'-methylthioadenosine phosphorylase
MSPLAVVLGSNAIGPGGERVLAAASSAGAVVLQRHGTGEEFRLPHRVDHAANLRSLLEAGCDRVLAIGSVGSLKEGIGVGSIVCPDDFIALQRGTTIFEDARGHSTPGFDSAWREQVLSASGAIEGLLEEGVYWETIGPRFETPAEIRMIAAHADVVGMTIASECVIAGELEIPYAALCVVDNLANGIGGDLSPGELEARRALNAERLAGALETLLPELG